MKTQAIHHSAVGHARSAWRQPRRRTRACRACRHALQTAHHPDPLVQAIDQLAAAGFSDPSIRMLALHPVLSASLLASSHAVSDEAEADALLRAADACGLQLSWNGDHAFLHVASRRAIRMWLAARNSWNTRLVKYELRKLGRRHVEDRSPELHAWAEIAARVRGNPAAFAARLLDAHLRAAREARDWRGHVMWSDHATRASRIARNCHDLGDLVDDAALARTGADAERALSEMFG